MSTSLAVRLRKKPALVAGAGFEPAMLLAYETEVVTGPSPQLYVHSKFLNAKPLQTRFPGQGCGFRG